MEKGNLSINSENILPIIKKWLYSDKDIFLRELVSNGTDAITKLIKLAQMGEAEGIEESPKYRVDVELDKENKIIRVKDNGIGMNADEIKEYITQIAFSGAEDFLSKYKDRLDKENEIIGHFGLGFYSAFMVASKVEIDTLSYRVGETAAKWVCDGGIEYEMSEGQRVTRGTTITLYIGEDGEEFLDEWKLREILKKYCAFMPQEIYLTIIKPDGDKDEEVNGADTEDVDLEDFDTEDFDTEDNDSEDFDGDDNDDDETDEAEEVVKEEPKPINDTCPLWQKQPKDCTDEEYKSFYRKVFMDYNEPLFWIHLNMDYPLRLKGILYFPKLKNEFETMEGQVKLYNNQVFVADNIKEVIPEFLLLLKGVMDCPDLPLNVSRSFLQNDGYATKMSGYISKKVGDKLNTLYKKEKETYEKFWDDIGLFVKYGCIKETSFYERVKEIILFRSTSGENTTLSDYLERNKEKHENKVFYVTDEKQQAQYVKMFKDNEMEALLATTTIDTPFISYLESQERSVSFARIDADLSDNLKDSDATEDYSAQQEDIQKLFVEITKNQKIKVEMQNLKSENVSGVILLSEQSRRMKDMSKMFGGMDMSMFGGFEDETTLVLNTKNNLVKTFLRIAADDQKKDDANLIGAHIYDLAFMSHRPFEPEAMTKFIERSNEILMKLYQR